MPGVTMKGHRRFWALLFVAVAVVAIILLAAGLSEIEFQPGQPLSFPKATEALLLGGSGGSERNQILDLLMRALYVCVLLLVPVAIVYFIISPRARRRVLRSLLFLLWILAVYLLMRARPEFFQGLQLQPLGSPPPGEVAARPVDFVANPPQWVVLVTAISLALLIAAGLVGAVWFFWRRKRRPESPLAQLAEEAQQALDALQAGADVEDTVMRCYFEMGRVLREQWGIRREEAMTPREFESYLAKVGLPDEHIGQLTHLFEAVRYGAKVPGEREERQAVDCLTAIIKACRSSP